ncbi:Caulimovirus DNA-binding protein [Spatholobus suberectus]|nr:Caulimovirus DNA-binding protein [Spatholobus suberectus]
MLQEQIADLRNLTEAMNNKIDELRKLIRELSVQKQPIQSSNQDFEKASAVIIEAITAEIQKCECTEKLAKQISQIPVAIPTSPKGKTPKKETKGKWKPWPPPPLILPKGKQKIPPDFEIGKLK